MIARSLARRFCSASTQPISPASLRAMISQEIAGMPREEVVRYKHDYAELLRQVEEYQANKSQDAYHKVLNRLIELGMFSDAHQSLQRMPKDQTSRVLLDRTAVGLLQALKPGLGQESLFSRVMGRLLGSWSRSVVFLVVGLLLYYQLHMESYRDNVQQRADDPLGILMNLNKTSEVKNVKTKFSDVQGINEFRQELEDIVDFLKNSKKYKDAGAYIPKGVLLVGPPGTGKTLLAKAIAGEAGCSFFYKSASEFEEVYVGVGAARVKELFKKARSRKPAIIFIDEIDSLSGNRTSFDASTRRQTINQLLAEMDGFEPLDNVIVIGATNMPDKIDKAVLRPGRFDKIINVPYPDKEGRREIFGYYLDKVKYDKDRVHLETLIKATTGFTGASIKNLVNMAVLNAIKHGRKLAEHEDFEFALDRITMGVGRKSMFVSDKEKLMTAYHEGGHTLVNLLTKSATQLHKVTILPRGGSLGATYMLPDQDLYYMNHRELLNQIQIALGGRVAEELIYGNGDVTTGCSSDMDKATDIAFRILREYGMHKNHLISRAKDDLSDRYNAELDREAQSILLEGLSRTRELLQTHKSKLDVLAHELVKKETLSREDIERLLNI